MIELDNIHLEFFNLKTQTYFSNYTISTDIATKTATIVSRPIETVVSMSKIKDISLVPKKEIVQTIR